MVQTTGDRKGVPWRETGRNQYCLRTSESVGLVCDNPSRSSDRHAVNRAHDEVWRKVNSVGTVRLSRRCGNKGRGDRVKRDPIRRTSKYQQRSKSSGTLVCDDRFHESAHGSRSATGSSHRQLPHLHSACRLAPVRWIVSLGIRFSLFVV